MRILRFAPALLVGTALLSGCGARAEREALRDCRFAPAGVQTSSTGDSLTISVKVAIGNPGARAAVLDSFSAIASGTSAPISVIAAAAPCSRTPTSCEIAPPTTP